MGEQLNVHNKKNIEDIRRKNLEDNQKFLKQLCMNDIRNDFVTSARSVLPKREPKKTSKEHEKVSYRTRYSSKLQTGEIQPHVPEWQRKKERKLLLKEQSEKLREERRKKRGLRRLNQWDMLYENNANPYQRVFKPRHSKIDERIEQEMKEFVENE